ncbi:TonB-dependent receptor [Yunchengibacter salinarum]|uniref:TonB-dependent receptor n=1 Tax=Yunchengibacter salinarum TaxID=3133399 RepID=UPI0035B5D613
MTLFYRPAFAGAGLFLLSATALTPPGFFGGAAQANAPETPEEITVTARGRAEKLGDLPDSVSVFTQRALRDRRITTVNAITDHTAGVYMIDDQDFGTNLITVRGVSTNRQQAPSIGYVTDGVQLADSELFTRPLYDVAQVEVLKGPQGALFGRSAIAGVFNVTTRQPESEPSGYVQAGIGTGLTWRLEGAAGGALSDKVAIRASGLVIDSNGFRRNTFLDKKVDGFESLNGRVQLRAELTDALTATAKISVLDERGGAAFISSGNVTGDFGGRLAGDALTRPFGDFEGRANRDWIQGSLRLNWTVAGGTLSSVTAHDSYDKDFIEELDFRNDTPITLFGAPLFPNGIQPISQPVSLDVTTQEVRYTSDDDRPIRFIVGGFYQRIEKDRVDDFGPLLFGAPAPRFETRTDQFAAFGQITADLTERLELNAALRYDRGEKDQNTKVNATDALIEARSETFDKVQPKLSLSYDLDGGHMLYATAALGFKPGGFNVPPGPGDIQQAVFPSEETGTLEAGAKLRFLNGRARLNLAGFITDYDNFQATIFLNGVNTVLSVDRVEVKGLEVDGFLQLNDALSLDANAAITDSTIKNFVAPNPLNSAETVDYSGNRTPSAPRFQINAGVQWQRDVGPGQLMVRADYHHVGQVFFEVDNVLFTPDRGFADLRASFTAGSTEFSVWAKNITDKRWAISAFGQTQLALLQGLGPGGPFDSFTINRGRRIGVNIRQSF